MKILFASQNKGKQNETRELLKSLDVELFFPEDFPELKNFEVDEVGKTFIENAILKAKLYSQKVNLPSLADDSGIIIDGLDGLPGVHSNRWFPGSGEDRNKEVLKRLKNISDPKKRSARYLTAACFYDPESEEYKIFEESQEGTIGNEILGNEGFDYDRIFIPEGSDKTFAQLGDAFKNSISQRYRAYNKIKMTIETMLEKNND